MYRFFSLQQSRKQTRHLSTCPLRSVTTYFNWLIPAFRNSAVNCIAYKIAKLAPYLLAISLVVFANSSGAEIYIISGDEQQQADSLDRSDVVNIFLGRTKTYENGDVVSPLDQNPENPVREAFYKSLTGKNSKQISAYWARLLFTGRHSPPQVINSEDELDDYLNNNRSAIAYTSDKELADRHTVLFILE